MYTFELPECALYNNLKLFESYKTLHFLSLRSKNSSMSTFFRSNTFDQSESQSSYIAALEQRVAVLEIEQDAIQNQTTDIPLSFAAPDIQFTDTLTDSTGDYIKSLQDLPQRVYDEVGAWDITKTYTDSSTHAGQNLPAPADIVDADNEVFFTDSFDLQVLDAAEISPLVLPPGKYFFYAHIDVSDMAFIKRVTCAVHGKKVSDNTETFRTQNFQFRPHTATTNPLWNMEGIGIPCTFFHPVFEDEHVYLFFNTIVAPSKSVGVPSTSRINFKLRITRIATI